MPHHKSEPVKTFAPKAWDAMCDLLGGEDRIEPSTAFWNDAFIVNLGTPETCGSDKVNEPTKLDNWHVDGDFFVHFLDSPEQALLVIPIFSDIQPRGGGTMVAPDSIPVMARFLYSHPEGLLPTPMSFTPNVPPFTHVSDVPTQAEGRTIPGYCHLDHITECQKFAEMTGEIGDVILLHPLMMHSRAPNLTRALRVITNPPVALKEPFQFSTAMGHAPSLVERKTIAALGGGEEGLLEWKITSARRRVVPERVRIQQKLWEEERNRLKMQAEIETQSMISKSSGGDTVTVF